jgi:hypothetical protein
MTALRFRWVSCLPVLLLAVASGAEEQDRFMLLGSETAGGLGRRLDAVSARGYRVMATGQGTSLNGRNRIVVLLEHRPDTGDVDYRVLETSGDFDDDGIGRSLNDWAGDGYRLTPEALLAKRAEDWWLPDASYEHQLVVILERRPDDSAYHYTRVGIGSVEQFQRDLAARLSEGYFVIGMWNSGRSLSVAMERVLGPDGQTPTATAGVKPDGDTYRLLIGVNRLGMKQQLKRASREGYGLLDIVDQSITAPPMVLLKRLEGSPDPHVIKLMYNPDEKIDNDRLEKKLNKKGRLGFRISSRWVTPHVVGLERPGEEARPASYRTLSSKPSAGLPRALEQALAEGYRFVTLVVSADQTVAVVAKTTDEPAF